MVDLSKLTVSQLLTLHSDLGEELRRRGVVRSSNNPTGDLAEYLFCQAYGWTQSGNSHPTADATGQDGARYQIKGRRLTPQNRSRQLSAMRDLAEGGFDFLAAVLFSHDYSVMRAAIVPHRLVHANSRYIAHTNSWTFFLRDTVWTWPGVQDVTTALRSTVLEARETSLTRLGL